MEKTSNNEEIILRPAWRTFWAHILFSFLVIPLLFMFYKRYSTKLILKRDSIVDCDGLISINEKEIFYDDIRTVGIGQSIFGRIFNYGKLDIATSGTGGYELSLTDVYNPKHWKELILSRKTSK
ncbi:MAG: PH domain-containing protein [Candidatus Muirbacterium halophilum]|nr:PH domain-containing protein [Candidatus Muirbacterium halophilum]MCK9477375.1 PH domain-containing protein [Candidatus Muirbacterium halophilum]